MIIDNVVSYRPALLVPGDVSFGQYVIDKLKKHSEEDGAALINGVTGHSVSYSQILQETVNLATGLKRFGVKRGDVVGLYSENCMEFLAIALGVVCTGATLTTFNVHYTKDELCHALTLSRPKIVFASENCLQKNLLTLKTLPSVKKIIQINGKMIGGIIDYRNVLVSADPLTFEAEEVEGCRDVVYILYSSGTTGLPKGVMLTHLNELYAVAQLEHEAVCDKKLGNTRQLTIMPWYHAYGLKFTIASLVTKKQMIYLPGFNPIEYLAALQKYKVTELAVVPPIVVFLGKSPLVEKYDLSSVIVVFCGAAPLSAETSLLARKRMLNCKGIFQGYGLTEATLSVTKDIIDGEIPVKVGSAGYPHRGMKMKIVDIGTRRKLGPNRQGEICVKGPLLMKGYIHNEAATREAFDEEGYLKTGDIGYYDHDGCLFVVDRLKELIKYKGNQVAPAVVESVILEHNGVAECGVVGMPDEAAGELPIAFVVLKPGVSLAERELLDFTDAKLSKVSRLHGVRFVKEIPKNPSGKILRRILKQKLINSNKSKL